MIDRDLVPLSPESILRTTIDEIVEFFAEPTNFMPLNPFS